jgi:proline iminopeptidase
VILSCNESSKEKAKNETNLWPNIEPFKSDYLKVSDLHEIYYELCGNPKGKPVFVIHGGPGGGCSPRQRQFFNPDVFLIVLHDQRGAGRSKPSSELQQNTTEHLVNDIELLRNKLKLEKILLFGGSWGATLALTYAEAYPENVNGMILRGVYLASKEENEHLFYKARKYYPDKYQDLMNELPQDIDQLSPSILYELLEKSDNNLKIKYSRAWAEWEFKLSFLNMPDSSIKPILDSIDPYPFVLIESYYLANGCFLQPNQIINNADLLANIPTIIVNGRYDMVCPPYTAFRLHNKLQNSVLNIVNEAGHSSREKLIEEALVLAVKKYE